MHINRNLSLALAFALLVGIGYIGIQYFHPMLFADRQSRNDQYMKVPDHSAIEARERAKPRFSGEIGGLFLAPYGIPIPEKFTTYDDLCDSQGSHSVPYEEAGVLMLTVEIPEGYILDEDNVNTDTVGCKGVPLASYKVYLYQLPNGVDAEVVIGRSLLTYYEMDAAIDRPQMQKIAGRDVVIVDTLTEDGFWQNADALFPEPFGVTYVHTLHLPRGEFMKLVQLIASSTRTQ